MTYLALLRGINVGGNNILPMKDLAKLFADAGCSNVRTYIQSGNVVFDAPGKAPKIAKAVSASIEKRFGYRAPIILRTSQQLRQTILDNPFLKAGVPEKMLYVYFLADQPQENAIAGLDPNRSVPDVFQVLGQEIFLHLPNGAGKSKLTNAYFDSKLSTICTARNWATVLKLAAMME